MPTSPSLDAIILALAAGCVILFFTTLYAVVRISHYKGQIEELDSRSRSLSTLYGQISEQWFPLMDRYPYDSRGFRFLGSPIDGIQFEEDRIVFCEFKSNRSALSLNQRQIKQLVQARQVYWEEFHFRSEGDR